MWVQASVAVWVQASGAVWVEASGTVLVLALVDYLVREKDRKLAKSLVEASGGLWVLALDLALG